MIQKILGKLLNFITFDTLISYLKKKYWNLGTGLQMAKDGTEFFVKLTNTPIDNTIFYEIAPEWDNAIAKIKNDSTLSGKDKFIIAGKIVEKIGIGMQKAPI